MAAEIVRAKDCFYVAFGTSSGQLILEKVIFNSATGKVSLKQVDVIEHSSAMLSMKRVQLVRDVCGDPLLVCGFTNGTINLYQVATEDDRLIQRVSYEKVHGFGVNCLDTVVVRKDNRFIVVSGGDDQAIAVTLFDASMEPQKLSLA